VAPVRRADADLLSVFTGVPLRFALASPGFCSSAASTRQIRGSLLHAERSFFGVHRGRGRFHRSLPPALSRPGSGMGIQCLDAARRAGTARLLRTLRADRRGADGLRREPSERIAVVGLGAGTLACYALSQQRWTFFEIDPTVLKLASDERYFTFLRRFGCPAADRAPVTARLSLAAEPDRQFDLLVLDAYSSDAIPVHLVTREALRASICGGSLPAVAWHFTSRTAPRSGTGPGRSSPRRSGCKSDAGRRGRRAAGTRLRQGSLHLARHGTPARMISRRWRTIRAGGRAAVAISP